MEYQADTQVGHDHLDQFLRSRGKEGWILREVLECCPPLRTEDMVTLIWERGAKEEHGAESHECQYETQPEGPPRCRTCGRTVADYLNAMES